MHSAVRRRRLRTRSNRSPHRPKRMRPRRSRSVPSSRSRPRQCQTSRRPASSSRRSRSGWRVPSAVSRPERLSNPLALLPLAIAAGGGRLGTAGTSVDFETQQLVAAGLTLLQRSAPLVRALNGRRSALLLPTSPAFVTALAASDGRGAVLINPLAAAMEIDFQCRDGGVGAIFTTSAFLPRLGTLLPIVLLDDAPRSAQVIAD